MKRQLFLFTTLILFTGLLGFFGVSIYITHNNNLNIAKDTVMETAQICAGLFNDNVDVTEFVKVGNDTRITIISSEGIVLADSRPLEMGTVENHLSRPEIQAATEGFPSAHIRYSNTLGIDLIYYALKINSGDSYVFVRTAIPVAKIDAYLYQSLPLLVLLLVVPALVCFLLIRGTTNRIIKPFFIIEQKLRLLSIGEYKPELITGSYEEVEKITRGIDDVALVLQNSFNALHEEKNKLAYILNNIGDGLFVIDMNEDILLINNAALGIFNVTPDIIKKKINYLVNDKTLAYAVEECVKNSRTALFELVLNGKTYFVTVERLPDTPLTMVILSDVTENRENAKRREEFFTNASHELKTPLTAIRGFNELASLNNKDESISKFVDGITRETDRMMSLIGDMLKLSELENTQELKPISLSLAKIANEVRETVSTALEEKAIIFEILGEAMVESEPEHVYELVKNLVENAVRYNNQGGKVSVTMASSKKNVQLIVSDNGIGISPKEQTRIFERFYRVEKSRSVKSGGTGLGLSIVKHICSLYGWKLSLKSRLNIGTDVIVEFIHVQ